MSAINHSIQNQMMKSMDPDLGIQQQNQLTRGAPTGASEVGGAGDVKGSGFFDTLQKTMEEVNANQLEADGAIKDLVAGKSKNIHETMLSIQKADLSLKTMMQVRNKILEAYKEIMRMQV